MTLPVEIPPEPVAFVLETRPKSAQSKGKKEKYSAQFSDAAKKLILTSPHFASGDLYLRVVYLFRGSFRIDVDNILKPIADAMRSVVYKDDASIVKCCAHRVDIGTSYTLVDRALSAEKYSELLTLISKSEHILVVEVGLMPGGDVAFGPIDAREVKA